MLLAGLANDGGLYVPDVVAVAARRPGRRDVRGARGAGHRAVRRRTRSTSTTLLRLCAEAYATFRHPATVPLVQIDDHHLVQELFHGPTLAFKDVALQLVGRLFDHVLAERGERITIVGATSGDTGSAAIDGVKDCANVDIVILYPHGRTSDVQRRQMTTIDSPNVRTRRGRGHVRRLPGPGEGDVRRRAVPRADAAQRGQQHQLGARRWRRSSTTSPRAGMLRRPAHVLRADGQLRQRASAGGSRGGWARRSSGFVVASNSNDIVARFIESDDMSTAPVVPTLSPSMDIQVSSNFERLLFEMNGRDGGMTEEQLRRFRATGRLAVEPDQRAGVHRGHVPCRSRRRRRRRST